MQRDGELLISGQISVDDMLNRMQQARDSAKSHRGP